MSNKYKREKELVKQREGERGKEKHNDLLKSKQRKGERIRERKEKKGFKRKETERGSNYGRKRDQRQRSVCV